MYDNHDIKKKKAEAKKALDKVDRMIEETRRIDELLSKRHEYTCPKCRLVFRRYVKYQKVRCPGCDHVFSVKDHP